MMKKDREILMSYGFLIALTILILNDLILKTHYPNWITGKLSDFSDLFVFPIFWTVVFPRFKKLIFVLTGLLFCIWNSPLIQPILNWFHSNQVWVDRVVDYSDNVALISLIVAYRFMDTEIKRKIKVSPILISLISLFAFTATTLPPRERVTYSIDKKYQFHYSIDTLCNRLNLIADNYIAKYGEHIQADSIGKTFILEFNQDTIYQKIDLLDITNNDTIYVISNFAKIKVWGSDSTSTLELKETLWYKKMHKDKDFAKKSEKKFRRMIIKELNKN